MRAPSDFDLLDQWRAGDPGAGDALFSRYFENLYGFFATKSFGDIDDLVQRTLLAALQAKHQFRKEASFRTFVFTLARNELYRHLERCRRDSVLDFTITSLPAAITTPVARIAHAVERREVIAALQTLPLEQQMLIDLHYWQGLNMEALAEVFASTPGAIRVRLHRARRVLRDRLDANPAVAGLFAP